MKSIISVLIVVSIFGSSSVGAMSESKLISLCESDCTTEYQFFRKYTEQGSSLAEFAMAIMLYQGIGVEQNIEKANRHLARAARKGEPGAQYQLGYFYEHGLFKAKNLKSARKWYYLASRKNTLDAKDKVAKLDELLEHRDQNSTEDTVGDSAVNSDIKSGSSNLASAAERITVVMQADYRQILKAAKIQTCNANCDPYWTNVLAPILKLKR
ncbi:sel1 repeat family protein [Psychrobium sp. MM17-31]|uniref:tetratricopeptide repeat protein n=1 Tax=Psychrobium sp. MM17-31 TaxID=2917758 RepID=UPI001EF53786|nr:tetratricopeptide repeat protein [Psychrobium sp. MM17-31]MCG7530474.1 sel1 repeat family protein [Psychrobium sp. MM17-31]